MGGGPPPRNPPCRLHAMRPLCVPCLLLPRPHNQDPHPPKARSWTPLLHRTPLMLMMRALWGFYNPLQTHALPGEHPNEVPRLVEKRGSDEAGLAALPAAPLLKQGYSLRRGSTGRTRSVSGDRALPDFALAIMPKDWDIKVSPQTSAHRTK